MGRYTTVQTYTDQDAKVAAISYSAATNAGGNTVPAASSAAPEAGGGGDEGGRFHINRVDNVSGSTAGAGSGEFHMYRAARRREMERVASMEKQYEAKKLQEEFEQTRKRKAEEFRARANKRADKRRRRKERQKERELAGHSDGEQDDESGKGKEKKEKDGEPVLETPGGVPAISNDGSFLEKMLALQQQQGKQENEEAEKKEDGSSSKVSKRR